MDGDTLTRRIHENYMTFSASERRVADLLLASPDLMGGAIATELAELASVSKATITRFVTKLGLESFEEFRRSARLHPSQGQRRFALGTPLQLMDESLSATSGDIRQLVAETLRADRDNLEHTYAGLSLEDITQSVHLLSTSKRLIFADFRKQFALAYYATTLFRVIRPGVETLPIPGASAVDSTLDFSADDLVVMFPFRRPERDQDILSHTVQQAGTRLIAIGDIWPNHTNQRAHVYFRCRTEGPGVFDSFVTPMSLINLLFTATANALGAKARDRLALLEERHEAFDTFARRRD